MHPNIHWHNIAGIRNVLRHEYHAISDRVIWKVIQAELPPLGFCKTKPKLLARSRGPKSTFKLKVA